MNCNASTPFKNGNEVPSMQCQENKIYVANDWSHVLWWWPKKKLASTAGSGDPINLFRLILLKKLYMCFVDLEKAFDRVPRKVLEWAMRKKGIPEVMVRAVMSLYEGAKARLRGWLELSKEFEVKVVVHQGSVLSSLVFVIVADVVTKNVRNCSNDD